MEATRIDAKTLTDLRYIKSAWKSSSSGKATGLIQLSVALAQW
jgi:hypothetical protein